MGTKNVLVVEDDDTIRKVLVMEFKKKDYRVFEYPDTVSAIESIKKEKPKVDAAIIDLLQKGYGGNLGEELRKYPEYKNTKIIYYSNLTKEQFDDKILKSENTFYLHKEPGSIKKLLELVDSL
jgi:DNA-binding response OmpR family regulator